MAIGFAHIKHATSRAEVAAHCGTWEAVTVEHDSLILAFCCCSVSLSVRSSAV